MDIRNLLAGLGQNTQAGGAASGINTSILSTGSSMFADFLTQQMGSSSDSDQGMDNYVETLKKEGFTGFFKKIEEDKLEKLREEILDEMGLTEEDLSEMSPERRAEVEAIVAREIQRRMALQSEEDEEDNKTKGQPASGIAGMMGFESLLPRQKVLDPES